METTTSTSFTLPFDFTLTVNMKGSITANTQEGAERVLQALKDRAAGEFDNFESNVDPNGLECAVEELIDPEYHPEQVGDDFSITLDEVGVSEQEPQQATQETTEQRYDRLGLNPDCGPYDPEYDLAPQGSVVVAVVNDGTMLGHQAIVWTCEQPLLAGQEAPFMFISTWGEAFDQLKEDRLKVFPSTGEAFDHILASVVYSPLRQALHQLEEHAQKAHMGEPIPYFTPWVDELRKATWGMGRPNLTYGQLVAVREHLESKEDIDSAGMTLVEKLELHLETALWKHHARLYGRAAADALYPNA
jgi:hypothetical protein